MTKTSHLLVYFLKQTHERSFKYLKLKENCAQTAILNKITKYLFLIRIVEEMAIRIISYGHMWIISVFFLLKYTSFYD